MTTHEIQTALLAYYKEKLEGLPEWGIDEYLEEHRIDKGVCYCAREIFKERIYDDDWVYENMKDGWNWTKTPSDVLHFGRPAVIAALTTRIDILTSLTSAQPNK